MGGFLDFWSSLPIKRGKRTDFSKCLKTGTEKFFGYLLSGPWPLLSSVGITRRVFIVEDPEWGAVQWWRMCSWSSSGTSWALVGPACSGTHCGWVSVLAIQLVSNSAWLGNCSGSSATDAQQQLKWPREDRKAAWSWKCCLARKMMWLCVELRAALSQPFPCTPLHSSACVQHLQALQVKSPHKNTEKIFCTAQWGFGRC